MMMGALRAPFRGSCLSSEGVPTAEAVIPHTLGKMHISIFSYSGTDYIPLEIRSREKSAWCSLEADLVLLHVALGRLGGIEEFFGRNRVLTFVTP